MIVFPFNQISMPITSQPASSSSSSSLLPCSYGNIFQNQLQQQFNYQMLQNNCFQQQLQFQSEQQQQIPTFPQQSFFSMGNIIPVNSLMQVQNVCYPTMQIYQQPNQIHFNSLPNQNNFNQQLNITHQLPENKIENIQQTQVITPQSILESRNKASTKEAVISKETVIVLKREVQNQNETKMSDSSSNYDKSKQNLVESIQVRDQQQSLSVRNEYQPSFSQTTEGLIESQINLEQKEKFRTVESIEKAEGSEQDQEVHNFEKKLEKKEKLALLKAQNKILREKLLETSNTSQKSLLLEISKASKQNSAKAFLKSYQRYALGKHKYIYNYDISENQYYYKVCRDMPLIRIDNPTKKDLEGFNRKFKKFFFGKQYNNNTLKIVIRNKLYGKLFHDFLVDYAPQWLDNSKLKNREDLKIIINFLLMCHDNQDYLVFLRDHDKSKDSSVDSDLE